MSGIAELYGSYNFFSSVHTVFQTSQLSNVKFSILHSHQQCIKIICSMSLLTCYLLYFFDDGQSYRYEVIS